MAVPGQRRDQPPRAGSRGDADACSSAIQAGGARGRSHRRAQPRVRRWRFNFRMSNTEPLIRLNVESRADADLMREEDGGGAGVDGW